MIDYRRRVSIGETEMLRYVHIRCAVTQLIWWLLASFTHPAHWNSVQSSFLLS